MRTYRRATAFSVAVLAIASALNAQPVWQPLPDYPMPRYQADLAASNNRLYSAGGPGPAASVYFASLNATGGFTGWTATEPLPQADSAPGLTAYGGYVYAALTNGSILRAAVQPDGSLGAWSAETNAVSPSLAYSSVFLANNGYLYIFGRFENGVRNSARFAALNPDGSVGPWQVGDLPLGLFLPSVQFHGGRVYLAGGLTASAEAWNLTYSAPINPDGAIGAWRPEADLPAGLWNAASAVVSNTVYLFGGLTNSQVASAVSTVYSGLIQSDGSVTNWTLAGSMPGAFSAGAGAEYVDQAGSVYLLGGANAGAQSTPQTWRWAVNPVTPPNQPPVAYPQTVAVSFNQPTPVILQATDPENDPLTYVVVSNPTNGALSGTAPNLVYTPNTNYSGPDAFSFKVSDGKADSDIALVTLNVADANQPPTAESTASPLVELSGIPVPMALSANGVDAAVTLDASASTDPDGDTLDFSWYDNGQALGHGPVVTAPFSLGNHQVSLVVSDGQAAATNQLAFAVVTASQAIEALASAVTDSSLPRNRKPPLLASLNAAGAAADRAANRAAVGQLNAFILKTRSQVARLSPDLAREWASFAQSIIDTLESGR